LAPPATLLLLPASEDDPATNDDEAPSELAAELLVPALEPRDVDAGPLEGWDVAGCEVDGCDVAPAELAPSELANPLLVPDADAPPREDEEAPVEVTAPLVPDAAPDEPWAVPLLVPLVSARGTQVPSRHSLSDTQSPSCVQRALGSSPQLQDASSRTTRKLARVCRRRTQGCMWDVTVTVFKRLQAPPSSQPEKFNRSGEIQPNQKVEARGGVARHSHHKGRCTLGAATLAWDGGLGGLLAGLALETHARVTGTLELSRLAADCRRAQQGDPQAFRAWVEQVTPTVWRLAVRMVRHHQDAQDLVQDVMVRAWQNLETLREPEASLAWVCQITRRAAADKVRWRGVREKVTVDVESPSAKHAAQRLADGAMDPLELVANQQAQAILKAALEQLPEQHRLVLLLCDVDGLGGTDAAAALGIPEGTLDSRLHRARAALGKTLRGMAARKGWRWW